MVQSNLEVKTGQPTGQTYLGPVNDAAMSAFSSSTLRTQTTTPTQTQKAQTDVNPADLYEEET